MYLDKIINIVNKLLSNSSSFKLDYDRLSLYLDSAVDNINRNLLTSFRTVSEYFEDSNFYYSVLKYIRNASDLVKFYGTIDDHSKENALYYNKKDGTVCVVKTETPYIDPSVEEGYEVFYYIQEYDIFVSSRLDIDDTLLWTTYSSDKPNGITVYDSVESLGLGYFNYNVLPDRYIRSCLVYYTAALYLEEEDELESQYKVYLLKAEEELVSWKKQFYSVYDTTW